MHDVYKNMSDYAVSTFLYENDTLRTAAEEIRACGFSTIEIWGDNVHLDPRMEPDAKGIKKLLTGLGLKVHSAHTPFRYFPGFGSAGEGRAWRLALWKRALEIYSDLEIPIAVIHALSRSEYNFSYDEVGYVYSLLASLADYSEKLGVRLALENIPSSGYGSGSEILCTLAEQERLFGDIKNLYRCLDLGHVAVTGNRMKEEIDCSFDRLITFHVHNNNGEGDSHNLPDDGIVDWPFWHDYIRGKGYTGQFVLEIFGGDNPSAQLGKIAAFFADRH